MKKYLALLKWAITKTPETALALLAALKISNWKAALDGVEFDSFSVKYQMVETLLRLIKERELVATIVARKGNVETTYQAATQFKNNGTDRLSIDGIEQFGPDFDFDISNVTNPVVRIELRYNAAIFDEATQQYGTDGKVHELVLSNKALKVF